MFWAFVLDINFSQCRKELFVSLFQTAVLMLFTEHDVLTYSEIKAKLQLEFTENNKDKANLGIRHSSFSVIVYNEMSD